MVFAGMAIHRCDILNSTMQMLMIIPMNKSGHPFPGCFNGRERAAGIIRPVLAGPEQRFRVRIVIADPGAAGLRIHPWASTALWTRFAPSSELSVEWISQPTIMRL
jgi:hypothetical protein